MPYNGSGNFAAPSASFPEINGTDIDAVRYDAVINDIATGLSNAICKDGQTTVGANIPFNGFKLTQVGPGSARTDAATLANHQDGTGTYIIPLAVAGTGDAITLLASPAIGSYSAGQQFSFVAKAANTGAVTVAISGLTAKSVVKNGTDVLVAGDIPNGAMVYLTYDGTNFQLGTTGAATSPPLSIPKSVIDAAGDLLIGTADNTPGILPIGTALQQLVVNAGATAPQWVTSVQAVLTAIGDLLYASAANTPAKLGIGSARQVLRVNAAGTLPSWDAQNTLGTPTVTTSGTIITVTGIPAGVRRVIINLFGVSTNGTSSMTLQLGAGTTPETTNYNGTVSNPSGSQIWSAGTGINLTTVNVAAGVYSGSIVCTLENASTNVWCIQGTLARTDSGGISFTAGDKTVSAALGCIALTTNGGANTFDAGEMNILYE